MVSILCPVDRYSLIPHGGLRSWCQLCSLQQCLRPAWSWALALFMLRFVPDVLPGSPWTDGQFSSWRTVQDALHGNGKIPVTAAAAGLSRDESDGGQKDFNFVGNPKLWSWDASLIVIYFSGGGFGCQNETMRAAVLPIVSNRGC